MTGKAKAPKTSEQSLALHPLLQKIFIVLSFTFFAVQLARITYYIIQQLPYNNNLSSFLVWTASSIVVPIYLFSAAYLMVRKAAALQRIFLAVLLTTIAVLVVNSIEVLGTFLYPHIIPISEGYWATVLYSLAPGILVGTLYPYFIYLLKKRNVI